MIQPNTIIGGRYRVIKPLGGGGMKLVYLAEDLRLAARSCALAEMVDSFTSPETQKQAIAAFQREADMLAQLSNEHIPRVFDRFSAENRHYLVMEFIDGITLEQKLQNAGGKLPESEVIDLALQVLDTLEYLHNLEPPVIYRDLKPSNLMITESGLVKLIDFGIARLFQPFSNATMIGTQGYAPPEQYRGKVEFRSDLYALGATMHHALSGRDPALEPPFSFPPLGSLCPDVTRALCDLVDQALKYDVIMRVADAAEFKHRLMEIKSGVPASPRDRGKSTKSSSRPQMHLPLGGVQSGAKQASAPTVLSDHTAATCPRCGRVIPVDSNFCSFCAADVTGRLGAPNRSEPEARTIVLDDVAERGSFPGPIFPSSPRRRRHRRSILLVVAAFFALGYMMFRSSTPEPSTGDSPAPDYSGIPSIPGDEPSIPGYHPAPPDPSEPAHTEPREVALRRALNAQGYDSVHFKIINGDSIVLWGTVPTEADRIMVQTQVFLIARIFSLEDHLQVHDTFAEP